MNPKLLSLLALAFGGLIILQAALGGWLFIHNVGIYPHEIYLYYKDKSLHGLLEVLIPHTLFIGIALMGILHFLVFIDSIRETTKQQLMHLLFSLLVVDQSSGLIISLGWESFAYVKLISWGLFQLALIWTWITLFQGSLKSLHEESTQRQ